MEPVLNKTDDLKKENTTKDESKKKDDNALFQLEEDFKICQKHFNDCGVTSKIDIKSCYMFLHTGNNGDYMIDIGSYQSFDNSVHTKEEIQRISEATTRLNMDPNFEPYSSLKNTNFIPVIKINEDYFPIKTYNVNANNNGGEPEKITIQHEKGHPMLILLTNADFETKVNEIKEELNKVHNFKCYQLFNERDIKTAKKLKKKYPEDTFCTNIGWDDELDQSLYYHIYSSNYELKGLQAIFINSDGKMIWNNNVNEKNMKELFIKRIKDDLSKDGFYEKRRFAMKMKWKWNIEEEYVEENVNKSNISKSLLYGYNEEGIFKLLEMVTF